jgi:hypothetical protein
MDLREDFNRAQLQQQESIARHGMYRANKTENDKLLEIEGHKRTKRTMPTDDEELTVEMQREIMNRRDNSG